MSGVPIISVVVIGRNEGQRLVRCLESIRETCLPEGALSREALEVIYVDSKSSDGSPASAERCGARAIQVHPERPSAACGRNAGWREARGEYVLFLDGDTILHSRFVAAAMLEMENRRIAIVWGHRRETHPEASIYNRVLDLDWVYAPGPSEFCGGDALIRRSVLEEVGGYDDTLIAGEEPEMCRRIRARGYGILHIDHPMTGHDLAIKRFGQYWKRAYRAGHAYAEVADRFRGTPNPLWEDDVRRNLVRGMLLLATPAIGTVASVLLGSVIPVLAGGALLLLLSLRTALKARWKSRDPITLLLYGFHSQFQQIPILFGQLGYRRAKRLGRRQRLIEYKEPSV